MNKFLVVAAFIALGFYSMPRAMAQDGKPAGDASYADRLQVAVQKICPVSGEELGSMGEPVKSNNGTSTVFLCCDGCAGKPVDQKHWRAILKNIAQAQKVCPITGKPVDASMKSIVVNGQSVFVCCPQCIAKIQADPRGTLDKVNANYAASIAEQVHIAAQGICPVSGEELGSMGDPIAVKIGDETAFLCCKRCIGKAVNKEHWAKIQSNLRTAQATCPVTGEPLPADAQSTVVDGQRIFVCCPKCIDSIKGDPATYLAKLNEQYWVAAQTKNGERGEHEK